MIKELRVVNWKCFEKQGFRFRDMNIINQPNGSGKSSMFQAIMFGIFGKLPPGFNLNSVRGDETKECMVYIELELNNQNIKVKRKFGKSNSVVLTIDNEVIATSSRNVFDHINQIIPYDVISVLWSPSTLSNSNILKPEFLVNSLLNYIFEDPRKIENHYKREIFAQNKLIKNIESRIFSEDLKDKDIDSINNEIIEIKKNLKAKSSSGNMISKANNAKDANDKLIKMQFKIIPKNICENYNSIRLTKDQIIEQINLEESKSNSELLKIPERIIKQIVSKSVENDKCLICNKKWNKKLEKQILSEIELGTIDTNKIIKLKENLKILERYNKKDISDSMEYYKLKYFIDICPNWKEIIEQYDEENNLLWAKLEKLEKQKSLIEQNLIMEKQLNIERTKLDNMKERLLSVSEYIKEQTEYYSNNMTEKASKIIYELNSRYDGIYLDEGTYKVSVIDSNMSSLNLLPVMQLSSGERTLVGISLILAAHDLFLPNLPMLFDESFSNLDLENVESLKRKLKCSEMQTFIITHDEKWSD